MYRRDLLYAVGASAVAGTTVLAGCTGTAGNTGGSQPTTTTGMGTTTQTTGMADGEATVRVASVGSFGDVLVDEAGRTLYRFEKDTGMESACDDSCAENWPPLTVSDDPTAGDGVTAALGTTERKDGTRQVTAAGHPLYYFAGDSQPGDANGQGIADVWYVVSPAGETVEPEGEEEDTTSTATSTTTTTASSGTY